MSNTKPQTDISVIVAVYNEEDCLVPLYKELVANLDKLGRSYEIIFIDDGSTDNTAIRLSELSPATVITFRKNYGKSQALQAGFDAAQGELVFTLDGDLQDDPKEMPRFVEKMGEGLDLVCGWKRVRHDPFNKRFFSKIANGITRAVAGTSIHDMNCCYKLYRAEVVKSLRLYGDMHRYIPALVADMGFRIDELPVQHRPRYAGKSKYGVTRLLQGLFDFLTFTFLRKFTDRPMHLFGLLGLLLGLSGLVILVDLAWVKLVLGENIGDRPLLLLGILLAVIGFQSFSLGFIGELLIRRNDDRRHYVIKKKIEQ
jgi:glycosyltransferase involved in cell wall biosynthesis